MMVPGAGRRSFLLGLGGLAAVPSLPGMAFAQVERAAEDVLRTEINQMRMSARARPLRMEPRLTLVAQRMADAVGRGADAQGILNDVAQRLDGADYIRRAHVALLRGGQPTPEGVLARWRADGGSAGALMTANLEEIGIAFLANEDAAPNLPRDIWVVVLADPLRAATSGWRDEVINRVNAFRGQNFLPPLRPNPILDRAAQGHAEDMVRRDFVSHVNPDGQAPAARALGAGYRYSRIAENLTVGPETPEQAVQAWIDSPPHRAAMLLTDVNEIGAGYVFAPRDGGAQVFHHYWTILLGRQ